MYLYGVNEMVVPVLCFFYPKILVFTVSRSFDVYGIHHFKIHWISTFNKMQYF